MGGEKRTFSFRIIYLAAFIFLLLGGLFFNVSCSSPNELQAVSEKGSEVITSQVDCTEIASRVTEEVAENNPVLKLTTDQLDKHYTIPREMLQDFCVYTSSDDTSAFEIAVFEIFSPDDNLPVVQKAINLHISSKAENYRSMNQAAYSMLMQTKTIVAGDYILVATCSNPQKAVNIFEIYTSEAEE